MRFAGFSLFVVILASSCGGDDFPAPRIEYALWDNTKELDAATLSALAAMSDDQATLTFASSTPLLDALVPGNVLLAGASTATPRGLLRRVMNVDRTGASIVVTTEPSTVFHAFQRLDMEMEIPVEGVESPMWMPPPPPLGPGAVSAPLTIEFPIGVTDEPILLFDGDGLPTPEDRVAGTGTLRAAVTLRFWLDFDWGDLSFDEAVAALGDALDTIASILTGDIPTIAELIHLRTGIEVDGDFEAALDLTGKSALDYDPEIPLGSYPLGTIPVGPLVFVPEVSLTARFDGGVTGEMALGYGLGANAGLGFEYDANGSGVPTPYVSGPTFTHHEPTATVTASARLRAELELSLRLALYGFAGPKVSITAYSEMNIDRAMPLGAPCYDLVAGFEGDSGASIGFAGTTLASVAGPSFDLGDPIGIASGDCEPLPDPPPTDAMITPWSRSYGSTDPGSTTDDDFVELELHHDGRLLLTTAGGDHVLKVEEDGDVTWAREIRQPDRPDFATLVPEHATPTSDTGILVTTHENVLVKLDAAGNALWGAQIETDNSERGFWAARPVNGDVFLGGTYRVEPSEDRQAWLLVLGSDGNVKTSWTWGAADHREVIRYILPLADGAVLVGEAGSFTAGETRGFVMRVMQDGTIAWAKDVVSCAGEEPVFATAVETTDGKIIVGGWHYATTTRAILFRLEPDGSDTAPAWATGTTISTILGLQPRSIIQLPTGELRVIGRWARTGGDDEVFIAATDSIGRFSWAQWYGGAAEQGPPTARITSQGGLLVAAGSTTFEGPAGGLWMFEVPVPNGAITYRPGSAGMTGTLDFTSEPTCLMTPAASTSTTMLPIGLTSVGVESLPATPEVHDH